MYFGVGGHPGFNLPLDDSLEFEEPKNPVRVGMTKDCFVSGDDMKFPLENDKILMQ